MRTIKIEVEYSIGDTVYITTDAEQAKYLVLGYSVRDNAVLYEVYNHNNGEYIAYGFELSTDKNYSL